MTERDSKWFQVYKYKGRSGTLVFYSRMFIQKNNPPKSGYLKPEGFGVFSYYTKLNDDDYVEKDKRMNKAHILAGTECIRAKISGHKDCTSKSETEEKCQSGLFGHMVQALPSPAQHRPEQLKTQYLMRRALLLCPFWGLQCSSLICFQFGLTVRLSFLSLL